jgi:hypothetical protein
MLQFFENIANFFKSADDKALAFLHANKWAVNGLIMFAAKFYQDNEGHEKMVLVVNILESCLKVAFLNKYSDQLVTKLEELVQAEYTKLKETEEI